MSVGVVLRRQSVLSGEAIQIWHARVADDIRIAVVFFDHEKNAGGGGGRRAVIRRSASRTKAKQNCEYQNSGQVNHCVTLDAEWARR